MIFEPRTILGYRYGPHKRIGDIFLPDLTLIADPRSAKFMCYPVDFTLTAGQTLEKSVVVEHRYWWWALTGNGTGTFRVIFLDGKTRQPLGNVPATNANILGTARRPLFLLKPHIFPTRRALVVKVTDTSNAANTVQVVLIGAIESGRPPV